MFLRIFNLNSNFLTALFHKSNCSHMECFNCNHTYDDSQHCPRLLPSCGHSLCEDCLKDNYFQNAVLCPECKTLNHAPTISSFPKNLALISIKCDQPSSEIKVRQNESVFDITEHMMCLRHRKKIEGNSYIFCIFILHKNLHPSIL